MLGSPCLTNLASIVGKTILAAIKSPSGEYGGTNKLLLVFDDETWLLLEAEDDGFCGSDNTALIRAADQHALCRKALADICSAFELFEHHLISKIQYDELMRIEADKKRARLQRSAEYHQRKAKEYASKAAAP